MNQAAPLMSYDSEHTPFLQRQMANAIRALSMDAVQQARSGHPGMPMGMADVATILFRHFLKFDAANPSWPDRDRFVLSAGHGSMLLYSLLYLTGYAEMTCEQLKNFRKLGSRTAGHPEYEATLGIETTTGPLGQGLATAVGLAVAERLSAARFSEDIVNHKTYVIVSDGDLMEGISHEAISLAGHLRLHKLVVLYDDNQISIDGPTDLSLSDDAAHRFQACGWQTIQIDGHDPDQIYQALKAAETADRPTLIACRTTIAYGAPTKAGTSSSHGSPLGEEEIAATRKALNWPHPPFEIPEDLLQAWRQVGLKGAPASTAWNSRFEALDAAQKRQFEQPLSKGWTKTIDRLIASFIKEKPLHATRRLSQDVLDQLIPQNAGLIGGSADLTGSNNTKAAKQNPISLADFSGSYIHYGVREHAMAACMNGISLHGGFIPYGGTFLVFSDYLRPALRLSALMRRQVIYVLTHDSIGLGEDGPTHQPIEHLAALRAMPNVNVFRPADAVEVAESWRLALEQKTGPSVLVLTRQAVAPFRTTGDQNLSARGAYIVPETKDDSGSTRQVTLFATGSEVGIALEAHARLKEQSISSVVVSMPCWELFNQQPLAYRQDVLGDANTLHVGIEAACDTGWHRYLGTEGLFFGMDCFGASAPAKDLYAHFNITAEAVVSGALERLRGVG